MCSLLHIMKDYKCLSKGNYKGELLFLKNVPKTWITDSLLNRAINLVCHFVQLTEGMKFTKNCIVVDESAACAHFHCSVLWELL